MRVGEKIGTMSRFNTKNKTNKQTKKNTCQEVPSPHKVLKMGYTSVADPPNRQLKENNHAVTKFNVHWLFLKKKKPRNSINLLIEK